MINYSKRDYFYKDSCFKNWQIVATKDNTTVATITNNELQTESITLTESICSSEDLVFGRCEPSKFEFTVHNIIASLKGCTITVDLILDHDTTAPFRVGTYFVDSDRPTANRDFRKVICYDMAGKLGETDVREWYRGLIFPMTLKQFRDSFFNHIGITQELVTLPNDTMQVYKTLETEDDTTVYGNNTSSRNINNYSMSAMTILNGICEINGCFGHIDRNNVFRYKYLPMIVEALYPADDLFPANDLYPADDLVNGTFYKKYYTSCEYEDYKCKPIDAVVLMGENSEIAATTNVNTTNPLKIEGNFLLYDLSSEQLNTVAINIYRKVAELWYSPCKIKCVSDLCIEVGDSYMFNDKYNIVYSYVFTRTMTGLQLMQDELESRGNEDRSKNLNSISAQLQRLREKSEWDIDVNKARIQYLEGKEAHFETLTAQNFSADRANIRQLYAEDVIISGNLEAAVARIGRVEADVGDFKTLTAQNFTADRARIGTLESDMVSAENLIATKASITSLNAVSARVGSLESDHVSTSTITAMNGTISNLNTEIIHTNEAVATKASITSLNAVSARVGTIEANYIKSSNLSSEIASITTVISMQTARIVGSIGIGGDLTANGSINAGSISVSNVPVATQTWVAQNFVQKSS